MISKINVFFLYTFGFLVEFLRMYVSSIDSVHSIFGHGRAVSLELVLDIHGRFLEIDDIRDPSRIGYEGKSPPPLTSRSVVREHKGRVMAIYMICQCDPGRPFNGLKDP